MTNNKSPGKFSIGISLIFGSGIGLYTANSNLIERNDVRGNAGSGIVASFEVDSQDPEFDPQPDSSSNLILDNRSTKNGDFGIDDESSGAGTGGTANTYVDNKCSKNTPPGDPGDSDPAGLCD